MSLPPDQQAIRETCYHTSDSFFEFPIADVESSIPERFEKIVALFPERLAVQDGNRAFTYKQLNQTANCIARAILEHPGIGDEPVALMFEHGVFIMAAILGILKTGRIYVPLDPALPDARRSEMLQDSQAKLLLTDSENLSQARQLAQDQQYVLNCDDLDITMAAENPKRNIAARAPPLILYTSGSTGRPKGVLHSHRNILLEASNYINDVRICPEDRLALCQSCGFANSIRNIFGALLTGAALLPYNLASQGIPPLGDWMRTYRITIFHTLATIMRVLLDTLPADAAFPELRVLRFGGEPASGDDVQYFQRRYAPRCVLMNVIGSTETFGIRRFFVPQDADLGSKVPLGYGVPCKEIVLLDEAGQAVGAGQIGEIAVRSEYLALGYWQRPELTRVRFVAEPDGGEERLYLTGDLGIMRTDGCLIHMGRNDFQVKIRGNRVEVSEIEASLLKLDSIRAAVVHAHADNAGEQRLVAYVVPAAGKAPTVSDLRRVLAASLPEYMMPSAFVFLESIPVVPNGRVDRSALPVPSLLRPDLETAFVPPRTAVEKDLALVWSEILSLDKVGIDDDFFSLGGHSLLAAKMFVRLDEKFGRTYPLSLLLSSPTIRLLAEHFDRPLETRSKLTSLVPLRSRGNRLPIFAVPGVFGNVLGYAELARELGGDQPFYALESVGLDGLRPPIETIEGMAEHFINEMRSVQSCGPYVILGACFGAAVAYEIARQLLESGNEVAYLGLIDPRNLEYRGDDAMSGEHFKAWSKTSAVVNLLSSRLKLYGDELRRVTAHERLQFVLRKAVSVGATLMDRNKTKRLSRELHQLEVERANRRAIRRYRRTPLLGRLTAFEVFESNHARNSQSNISWHSLWSGEVRLYRLPAKDSADMLVNPNLIELSKKIAAPLDTAPRSQMG
jgi:amino acid adenylation domain-containing protein